MKNYCLYLRKSRADAEAEMHGEGDTLARHESALLDLAKKKKLNITQIYREVVSGETIASRPVMQQLLSEVEQGLWAGVLVMEVERLARGDTVDQGIMAQTFKYSDTLIITPLKTYDPNNEFDEEYFEFGLFMSRREYKTINRRLQRGRLASVMEGKYVANKAPYGYERVKIKDDKGFTLAIVSEEAKVVKLIFDWYVNGITTEDGSRERAGSYLISRRLNDMQIPSTTKNGWGQATIRDMLMNPVYMGKIRWNWRKNVRRVVDGEKVVTRPRQEASECVVVDGLHPAIIDEITWHRAQQITAENANPRTPSNRKTKNPLAGLIVCGKCGRKMVRRPYAKGATPDTIMCAATNCDNVSSYMHYIEDKVLVSLAAWLEEYKVSLQLKNKSIPIHLDAKEKAVETAQKELLTLEKQKDNLHDLLEQGVYDTETFLERSQVLADRLTNAQKALDLSIKDLEREKLRSDSQIRIIPKVEKLLSVYDSLPSAAEKNTMLKEVLEKAVYVKEVGGRWHASPDDFSLILYPRIQRKD